jgi:two-component system, NarL family, nitrate/nitrite response regulator NarL
MPAGAIRVIVADQEPLFRDALGRALREDAAIELVAEAADPASLAAAVAARAPAVALVDAALLDDGLAETVDTARVIVLAALPTAAAAYAAVEAGARGYLSKDAAGDDIRRAVAEVARGETVVDPALQTGLAREIRLRVRDERPPLTPREHEILVHVAEGRSAPEIARRLHLSTATVKTHLLHLYDKLGVADRAAAVAEGMRRGLLE